MANSDRRPARALREPHRSSRARGGPGALKIARETSGKAEAKEGLPAVRRVAMIQQ